MLTIQPRSRAHIRIVEASLSESSKVGETAILTVVVENDGTDSAFVRVCLSDICGRWTEQPFASSLENGPGQGVVEFQFELENDSLDGLYLDWDSASAGTHGTIKLEVDFKAQEEETSLLLPGLVGVTIVILLMFKRSREG